MLYIYVIGNALVPSKQTNEAKSSSTAIPQSADRALSNVDSQLAFDASHSRWTYHRRLCQTIAIVASAVSACNALALWLLFDSAFGAVFDLAFCVTHLLAFYWINNEKYTVSAYWTMLLTALQVSAGVVLFVGASTGFQFYLLCLPAVVYLLLPREANWRKTALVIVGFSMFVVAEQVHIAAYRVELSNTAERILYFLNVIFVITINYLAIKYFSDDSKSAYQEQKELVLSDSLTGLSNRRFVVRYANKLLALCERYHHPLSIIMLDIDNFKKVNDLHGHLAGDNALLLVADCLRDQLRSADIAARYGGEEFIILLPETGRSAANNIAEQLRQALEQSVLVIEGKKITITASFGVSHYPPGEACSVNELIKDADDALYRAKNAGKNQVVSSDSRAS